MEERLKQEYMDNPAFAKYRRLSIVLMLIFFVGRVVDIALAIQHGTSFELKDNASSIFVAYFCICVLYGRVKRAGAYYIFTGLAYPLMVYISIQGTGFSMWDAWELPIMKVNAVLALTALIPGVLMLVLPGIRAFGRRYREIEKEVKLELRNKPIPKSEEFTEQLYDDLVPEEE